jgi:Flp pilus assembly protein TadB
LNTQTAAHPTYYRFLYFTALAFALGVAAGGIFSYIGAPIVSIILFVLALFVALYAAAQIRARQRRTNAS